MDDGEAIHYAAVERGTPVYGSDGVRGLLYGDFSQFVMQAIDCAVLATFAFLMAYAWFKLSDLITPIRVSKDTEIEGLDEQIEAVADRVAEMIVQELDFIHGRSKKEN